MDQPAHASADSERGERTPVRTCVGCRQRAAQEALVRVVAEPSETTPGWVLRADPRRRLSGRGAYVHPTTECVQSAISRQAFGRALRRAGRPSTTTILDEVLDAFVTHQSSAATRPTDTRHDPHAGPHLAPRRGTGSGFDADEHPMSTQQ